MKRLNITMDDIVANRLDAFCKKNNIARSKLISLAVSDYITAQEQLPNIAKDLKLQLEDLEKSLMSKLAEMALEQK